MDTGEFQKFQNKLKEARKFLSLPDDIFEELGSVKRFLEVSIPVRMDDGTRKIFRGYRSQYNDALGPFKGGIRFHENVNPSEIQALSAWMALKCAVVGIPLGGGKGGVVVNPKKLSEGERERLSRGYIRAIFPIIGPKKDIPAPDVNTDAETMGWMLDEYETLLGMHEPGVITGKPLVLGGSKARSYATAQGGFFVFEEAMEKYQVKVGSTVSIQGFGNAGRNAAEILFEKGYKVIAVSDSSGIAENPRGLDVPELSRWKKEKGTVSGFSGGTESALFAADIFIPAALENSVGAREAERMETKIIVELANGPLTTEAEEIFGERKIPVVPDIVANAGGVAVSYFEQVQNASGIYWEEKEVITRLEKLMRKAFREVSEDAQKHHTTLRMGAYVLALGRITEAIKARGKQV